MRKLLIILALLCLPREDSCELPLLRSGEGEIVLETDGTDWYVCQKEKTDRTR